MKFDRIVLQVEFSFLFRRHTFKMATMTSARRWLLHIQQHPSAAR